MKRSVPALILSLLLCVPDLQPQPEVHFGGYLFHLPSWQRLSSELALQSGAKEHQWIVLNRLRLRPSLRLNEDARIEMEYEVAFAFHDSPVASSLASSPRQSIDTRFLPLSEPRWTLTHFLDRLYYKQEFSFGSLIAGRQRISWGTGRVWNPTDLFNPLNPAQFDKIEKDGADAVTMKFYLGALTDAQLVWNTENRFRQNNVAMRARTNIWEFDLSIMGGVVGNTTLLGADAAGNLFLAGIRGEALFTLPKDGKNGNAKWIVGIDNQFTPVLYAALEYYFNGGGSGDPSQYDLAGLMSGKTINLGRQYLSVITNIQIDPITALSLSAFRNLNDASGFGNITLNHSLSDEASASLGCLLPYGTRGDEYWLYPTSAYLRLQYFF